MYIKSDASKHKLRDKYIILSLDNTAEIAMCQKLLESNPRKNIIPVQYKNLYPSTSTKSILKKPQSTPQSILKKPHLLPPPSQPQQPCTSSEISQTPSSCFFCKKTDRKFDHDPRQCKLLSSTNPMLYSVPQGRKDESDSEEEVTPQNPPPNPPPH